MAKEKKKVGHPPKELSEAQIQEIESLSGHFNVQQMADHFGISRDTFFKLKRNNPEIQRLYKKGRSTIIKGMVNVLIKAASEGNITAAMFYLKTQAGWREKTESDTENADTDNNGPQPLLVRFVGKEDLKEVRETKDE